MIQDNQTDNTCWSRVGNQQNGIQLLELSDGCFNNRSVPHELLHATGMYHEHTRPDRDDYVEIHQNCITPKNNVNFVVQKNSLTYNLDYNHRSIMHYSSGPNSCKSITSKVSHVSDQELGSNEGMTKLDYQKIAKHYGCPDNCKYS